MAGERFDLRDNKAILKINSPQKSVGGPYTIVHKDIDERYVIVALGWNNDPALGIRWFWDAAGNPISRGYPTWFIIPSGLYDSILKDLPIKYKLRRKIDEFLQGKISGNELV